MKAIAYSKDGSPEFVTSADVEKPAPTGDQVLIRVRAASVNPADWRVATASPLLRRLLLSINKSTVKRPGIDVAGQIEAVGANVSRFRPGDEVFGVCPGAYAEFACASETKLTIKPANITFEQAASVPVAAVTALQGLRDKGHLQPGHKILINGAAGGVGTFAVQIARSLGAHVTGVCSTRNVELVRSLGADRVIDYSKEDFTKDAERYDLMLDNIGNHSLTACLRVLTPTGILVLAGGPKSGWRILVRLLNALVLSLFMPRRVCMFMARITNRDLDTLAEFMRVGNVTPTIDRSFPLAEVAQAMRYAATGHARAKVVITIGA